VLLLGEFAGSANRDLLIDLIDDPQVASHAITALRQAKIGDAVDAGAPQKSISLSTDRGTEGQAYARCSMRVQLHNK